MLGLSAFFHDAAAALVCNGEVVAAAQEERFTRRKGDPGFPAGAVASCLAQAGISLGDVSLVAFHEKPWLHFERLLETYLQWAPRGWRGFLGAMPPWIGGKLLMRRLLRRALGWQGPLVFTEHHEAHLAAAFFPSPFPRAAALAVDGVGEWATTSWGVGDGPLVEVHEEIHFPHSLGLLYSAMTAYLGFRVNSGEYKVMGLAPYGEPTYAQALREHVIALGADGSFQLNLECFDFTSPHRMTTPRFHALFGGPPRELEGPLEQRHADVARSLQVVLEEVLLGLARQVHRRTGLPRLVLAGGIALNCVANARLLGEGPFEEIWIQPAAGDAGSALGCALVGYHRVLGGPRPARRPGEDGMRGAYLGPAFTDEEICAELDALGAVSEEVPEAELIRRAAALLDSGAVVGWFQGPMEFGPRALGARSILADPRRVEMQRTLNLKIKLRESFRPFAPAVLADRCAELFDPPVTSPYMLLVSRVAARHQLPDAPPNEPRSLALREAPRSTLPAITHVDHSARLQTVDGRHQPRFHALLRAFAERTGTGCLVNTSFNVRGEPIVCRPADAYRCFRATGMDYLLIGSRLLDKEAQREPPPPPRPPSPPWRPRPSAGQLRAFGWLLGVLTLLVPLLAGTGPFAERWAGPWVAARGAGLAAGLALLALGTLRPGWLGRPYALWMGLARALGRVTTPLVLGALYLLALLPIALVHRARGGWRSAAWPPGPAASTWQPRADEPRDEGRYHQQF